MPQISTSVKQEIVDAINKIRENSHKKLQKVLPSIEEFSFSEITATLLSTHPEIVKYLPKK